MHIRLKQLGWGGDTIVEVLIAIAIASFAIGTSYALSNKSLQNAITASDRSQALNIAQNQIADLKYRHSKYATEDLFNAVFGAPSGTPGPVGTNPPVHGRDYCLVDGVLVNTDPNWGPQTNPGVNSDASAGNLNSGTYSAKCIQKAQYYVNITAEVTSTSANTSANRTVFKVSVHWPQVGGGIAEADIYYRF